MSQRLITNADYYFNLKEWITVSKPSLFQIVLEVCNNFGGDRRVAGIIYDRLPKTKSYGLVELVNYVIEQAITTMD